MNVKVVCACVVAIIAILALLLLFYVFGSASVTGALSTNICPPGSAPIIAEGPGMWYKEIKAYERLGHYCFFGYDGITPCCARTQRCCLPFSEWAQS